VPGHVKKALAARFAEMKNNGEGEYQASPPRD
jgi:hypothetical protein